MLNYQRLWLSIWGSVWRCFCSLLPTAETGLVVERQNRFVGCGGKKPLHPAWLKILFPTEWPWNIMKCCVLHFGQTQISSNAVVLQCRPLKWCTQNPEKAQSEPGRTHQNPRHAGGPETCRVESQQVPHTLRSELPGECLWSWNYPNWTGQSYFQLIPTLTGSTQLAKYSKFLLAYRFETCSPSEPPNPELCSALHRMPPLWCEPALYPGKCLGLQFISKFICKFHWCAKGLIDVYWSFCRHTYTTCINSYIYILYHIFSIHTYLHTQLCVCIYIYVHTHMANVGYKTNKQISGWLGYLMCFHFWKKSQS